MPVRRQLVKTLRLWQDIASDRRRAATLMKRVAMRVSQRELAASWLQWRSEAEEAVRAVKMMKMVAMRVVQRELSAAWCRWHSDTKEAVRVMQLQRKALVKVILHDLSNSLMLIPNQQRRTNNAGKQSPLRSHLPDNGYAEYLQQSQNI